ncbi:hypothetical protein ACOMHN_034829 [Nucella lapillus]
MAIALPPRNLLHVKIPIQIQIAPGTCVDTEVAGGGVPGSLYPGATHSVTPPPKPSRPEPEGKADDFPSPPAGPRVSLKVQVSVKRSICFKDWRCDWSLCSRCCMRRVEAAVSIRRRKTLKTRM